MLNLKRPLLAMRDQVLSEHEENYMLAKPDILIHSLDAVDDILIFGNNAFFNNFPPS